MRALLAALCLAACTACFSSLDGFRLPNDAREKGRTFRVLHQPKDERNLDQAIAAALRGRGLEVVSDGAGRPDYLVSYVDQWWWDYRTYLVLLRIDVRDAKTNQLVATGHSFMTSMAAMGETHATVIARTVDVLLSGSDRPAAVAAAK